MRGEVERGETALRELNSASLKPVYFLLGDHTWLREKFIAKLRELVVPEAWRSLNVETLHADETAEADAAELALTPPFGSPRRFLLIRGIEAYRGSRATSGLADSARPVRGGPASHGARRQPPLLSYLRAPAPTTVLALSSERWDTRRWREDGLFAAAGQAGVVVLCARPEGESMQGWLTEQAVSLGLTLEPAAVQELIERVGEDPLSLCRELEKLASYVGEQRSVTVQDVQALTGELATPSVFQFLDVLFVERRPGRALSLLNRLLKDMHPLQLHAMLLNQLRKMIALKGVLGEGLPPGAVAARVKLPVSLVSRLGLMAGRTPPGRFAELLRSLASAEARLKRGRDGREVLEGLVLECCR